MRSIVWLASYPKSGNTWLRAFLANYVLNRETPLPINEIYQIAVGDSVPGLYARVAGKPVNPADERAILALRGKALQAITANGAKFNLVKTHNPNGRVGGLALIPPELTRLGLYIVRNPLDMILSYADHYGLTAEQAAEAIASPANRTRPDPSSTAQYLGDWSGHVKSWTGSRTFPVMALRYEDMLDDPEAIFRSVLQKIGVPVVEERLERAIRFSSFKELSRQEAEGGFRERTRHSERFFRAGRAGQWQERLPPAIVERIRKDHGPVMKRHGYLA